MKHTNRIFGLIAASLLSSVVIYGQSARVIYVQDDNFPFATTEFRSPWNGGDVGNNNFMPDPTGRIFSRNEVFGTTAVIHVSLQDFTGGDSFGRLALVAGNGFWTQGSSEYNLPSNRSNGLGPGRQTGTVLFGTWVGSGHQFGMRAAANRPLFAGVAEARADVELRNAPMVSLVERSQPHHAKPCALPVGRQLHRPDGVPECRASAGTSGAVSGTRGLVNFSLVRQLRNSPHSDRLRVRTILSILKNGNPFYTDTDDSFVDWAAGDGTFSKTVCRASGDTYTLNIAGDPDNTQYCISLRVQVFHDGFYDNFGGYAGTVTLV
jgi:hypothetical protein